MEKISEVIKNIRNYQDCKVIIKNEESLKISIINFEEYEGYLNIYTEKYQFNKKGNLVNSKKMFQYSNNPEVLAKLNLSEEYVLYRLISIVAYLVSNSILNRDNMAVKTKEKEHSVNGYRNANNILNYISNMSHLTNQDMTEIVDMDVNALAEFLREKAQIEHPFNECLYPALRTEEIMTSIKMNLDVIKSIEQRIKHPLSRKDREVAIMEWKELSYDENIIELVPTRMFQK